MPLGKGFRLRSSWATSLLKRRTPKGLNAIRSEVIPQKENIVPLQNWWNLDEINPISITGVGNIASAEAFGLPTIALDVSPSSISSSEAFGNPAVSVSISPSSITSQEAFGLPTINASPPSPNTFRVGGGGNYDPHYWDKVRQKREEEELMVLV